MQESVRHNPSESGIALILVAVAVVVVGVFMALGLGIFDMPDQRDFEKETRQRMDRLVDQLSEFAQEYGRVPCPADPSVNTGTAAFGWEARTGGAGSACSVAVGVVPFRSLGLDTRDGQDGWSRYFTYSVSPVFATLDGVPDHGVQIFNECRIELMWVDSIERLDPEGNGDRTKPADLINGGADINTNLNPTKAKFCCPGIAAPFADPNTDLVIRDAAGVRIPTRALPDPDGRTYTVRSTASNVPGPDANGPVGVPGTLYADIDTPFTLPGTYSGNASAFAFVLVSHGQNGLGAFQTDGTANRIPGVLPGSAEEENGDVDITFVDRPRILTPGANYYDDFIEYRTQQTLYGELGRKSCIKPYL